MREKEKLTVGKVFGIVGIILIFAIVALLTMYIIHIGGRYPEGTDTMCHVYKGDVLYNNILEGNWYPLYDRFWYNGVQMMRYWAPFPVYFLAFCQMLAGGDEIAGYLIFVGLVLFLGALSWLYIGVKKKRILLGAFIGILWFFMPNNLYALFIEGNLPRSLSMVLLPLLFYFIYEYLFEDNYKVLGAIIPVFIGIVLCHVGYAGMILLAMLVFLLMYKIIYKKKKKCIRLLISLILPFLISGIWVWASLQGGITSTDSSQVMATFFQDALISLNPIQRLRSNNAEFYFGLAAFIVALTGALCSKRKSMVGFWTAIIIFICTTSSMYPILKMMPGSQYLWMLRFISIALCMILYSLLIWATLRKWIMILCCVLLLLDCVPSLNMVYTGVGELSAQEMMELTSQEELIDKAHEVTTQRAAILDESLLGAMAAYLLTDYNGNNVQSTFGAGWQSAATAANIVQLNEAMAYGYYYYLFDRGIEMGNDTMLIKISQLKNKEKDIEEVTQAAESCGYELVASNTGFLLYHLDTYDTFGTICQYNGIGIGSFASLYSLCEPDIEEGVSDNLNEYTFEELSKYKVVYLSGFTYNNKEQAEQLLIDLSEEGVLILITGDGIPIDEKSRNQEFLGVTCQRILFENGYPFLYKDGREFDCNLFDRNYREWQTVYFNGLDKTEGYLYANGKKMDFAGNVINDNIYFLGLNLPYHYMLTHDETAGELLKSITGDFLRQLPDRQIVPLEIEYGMDTIRINSEYDDVNTSLAYHDIFETESNIYAIRSLLYVGKGTTEITMSYPYLVEGAGISLLGISGTVVFLIWIWKSEGKKNIRKVKRKKIKRKYAYPETEEQME